MEYSLAALNTMTAEYGSPLYCFEQEAFAENFREFVQCFQNAYPRYRLSYSYKTNYTPAICRLVKELGGYAEVVSDMEYALAKQLGYDPASIIYNGPCKGELAKEHFRNGGILNVDGLDELRELCSFARSHADRTYRIGLRLNIEVGQPFLSRFGIDTESDEPESAKRMIESTPNLKLAGLHCHVSQARALESWRKRTEILLSFADRLFPEPPEYLDLGSGMYGKMDESLSRQFSAIPTYEEYASVTAEVVAKHYAGVENPPLLFTEPGTTVVSKYLNFCTRVVAVKNIKGKTFVVTDGSSHNIGEICKLKKLPLQIVKSMPHTNRVENADIVGYTCLEHDVLFSGISGDIAVGDYIVFGNVGGYSNVSKPPFIRPNCAMIARSADGKTTLIKHAESQENIFSTYVF